MSVENLDRDLLQPAIAGTTSALKSAVAAGTVRRVVVTSSFGAVFDVTQGWRPGYVYTEVCFPM